MEKMSVDEEMTEKDTSDCSTLSPGVTEEGSRSVYDEVADVLNGLDLNTTPLSAKKRNRQMMEGFSDGMDITEEHPRHMVHHPRRKLLPRLPESLVSSKLGRQLEEMESQCEDLELLAAEQSYSLERRQRGRSECRRMKMLSFNTFHPLSLSSLSSSSSESTTIGEWTLRVHLSLFEDQINEEDGSILKEKDTSDEELRSAIDKVIVMIPSKDECIEIDEHQIAEHRGFELTRKGSEDCEVKLQVYLKESRSSPFIRISVGLAALLGYASNDELLRLQVPPLRRKDLCSEQMTRDELLRSLREYLKLKRGSSATTTDGCIRDGPLRTLLLSQPQMGVLVSPLQLHWGNLWSLLIKLGHVKPVLGGKEGGPIEMTHTVKLKGSLSDNTRTLEIRGIRVTLEDPRLGQCMAMCERRSAEIEARMHDIREVIRQNTRDDRTIFQPFYEDPERTMDHLMRKQEQNLRDIIES